jgi:hypothetical protein
MITEEELSKNLVPHELEKLIAHVAYNYRGLAGGLYESVGILVVGRLLGWRVTRLVSSRSAWEKATALFGDLKVLMPERGKLAYKSLGLETLDKIGGYWDFISGRGSREGVSPDARKTLK